MTFDPGVGLKVVPVVASRADESGAGLHPEVEDVVERVVRHQSRGVPAQVRGLRAAGPVRQQPLAEQHDDERRCRPRGGCRRARTRRSRTSRRLPRSAASEMTTLTGLPVRSSMPPALPANASGISSCEGGRLSADRNGHRHREQRGDRAVQPDDGSQHGAEQHREEQQAPGAVAGSRHELLADPGGHAGRVETLADHEQGGDQDDCRVAEPGQRLAQVEHAGEVERQRGADGDDLDREPVPDEEHDHSGENHQADGRVAHQPHSEGGARCRSPARTSPAG